MTAPADTAAIVIGRNEGARLVACLASLQDQVAVLVYVDSGSTDGSLAAARDVGAEVVELDRDQPFTAARARNAGLARLSEAHADVSYVQFVDGDCTVQAGWVAAARAFLQDHTEVAVVCGRRRERHPDHSIYNRLIDREWDTPPGPAKACGGDALMRLKALRAVGGFNPALIAGEEPELCVRLRAAGWGIWRLEAEMTLHDAEITRLSQWWRRAMRAGHAYAEGAALHGAPPERHRVDATRRALIWGLGIPGIAVLGGGLISPWFFAILLAWPAQVLRLALRQKDPAQAFFLTLGKLPEALGVLTYYRHRIAGARSELIEYK